MILIISAPVSLAGFDSEKTLVVYFSRVGNTDFSDDIDAVSSASLRRKDGVLMGSCEVLADKISQITGADIFTINVSETYPESYDETVSCASREQSENASPELTSHIDNMESYDNIILIYPVWWSTMPMPVFSFLEEYNFSDKNIYPIATHKGSFLGQSVSDIKEICPTAEVHTGIALSGGSVDFIGIIPFIMIVGWALTISGVMLEKRLSSKSAKVTDVMTIVGLVANVLCVIRILI
ncbi:MAG: NAD(P)H-dependent oxidoreductase [Lachnospiraceae bacterium]|nr:NAD(P)H-dependent oxidoreductase [Lachnospiraceae bacterium]